MGVHKNIGLDKFPEQDKVGKPVSVCFNYDTSKRISGVIVRDDVGDPWRVIIKLDDGRYVLDTECQFAFE